MINDIIFHIDSIIVILWQSHRSVDGSELFNVFDSIQWLVRYSREEFITRSIRDKLNVLIGKLEVQEEDDYNEREGKSGDREVERDEDGRGDIGESREEREQREDREEEEENGYSNKNTKKYNDKNSQKDNKDLLKTRNKTRNRNNSNSNSDIDEFINKSNHSKDSHVSINNNSKFSSKVHNNISFSKSKASIFQ